MKIIALLLGISIAWVPTLHSEGVFFTNVNSPVYNSRENIRQALKVVSDLGLKVVYPCVWNKNYAFWNSKKVAEVLGTQSISLYGQRDILQEFIDEAKPFGIKVVPWFEYGLKVVLKKGDDAKSSTWTQSGKKFASLGWLTHTQNGNKALPFKWGVQKGFLSPSNPEVIEFLNVLVKELSEYSVDAVLIDDHFSMKPGFGYDKYSNQLAAKYNANGMFPSRKKLVTDSITDLLILLGSTIRASGKRFILSPAGDLNFSKGQWMQDWYRVVRAGVVDQLLMQVYRYNLNGFKQLTNDSTFNDCARYSDLGVVVLSGLKNNSSMDANLIHSQTRYAQSKNMKISYFYYDSLLVPARGKETGAQRVNKMQDTLRSTAYKSSPSPSRSQLSTYSTDDKDNSSDYFEDLF